MTNNDLLVHQRESDVGNFMVGRLERAKEDWKTRRFPTVPGDETYIPIPEYGGA